MTDDIYTAIFTIAEKLELPVLILALMALAILVLEGGAFAVELHRRTRRRFVALARASASARDAINAGRRDDARAELHKTASSVAMSRSYSVFVDELGLPDDESRINKELADFEFDRDRRLARTRLLVRIGPTIGLMGTLIPLSPALDGLARGNVAVLTENLRVAFSITVLGLLIGGVAFVISLTRERMYGQDYSDLEYVASILTSDRSAPQRSVEEVHSA